MTTFPRQTILVPAVALVIAVLPLPYGYYTLLRLGITTFAAFFAYIEHEKHGAFTGCQSALNIGSDAILVVRGLSGANDAGLKEVDFSSTVHLAFYELELGKLPPCLSI
ncbi:DUF6804 family protein [Agrobacterium tumefaciens]|uniref:DUF6804 family protein n=1 Tax=Agrobacterium tumefaciens TaxID=358 RepID=UPI001AD9894F|nr:DUF6804 family protein [Agrobacterium tumefaciens]